GGSLGTADITADGSYLFVTDRTVYGANAEIHKIDLNTGADSPISYARGLQEGGSWDVAIGSDGNAYVTSDSYGGQSSNYVWLVNTSTGAAARSTVLNEASRTNVGRSADRKWLVLGQSGQGVQSYSVASKAVVGGGGAQGYSSTGVPAENADGS